MELQILSQKEDHAIYFREFIHQLVQKFKPLQIFSFFKNSYTQGDQGCFKEKAATFHCNYCLLLITDSNTRIEHEIQDFTNGNYKQVQLQSSVTGKKPLRKLLWLIIAFLLRFAARLH